jgi:hypothetical protein
MRFHGQSSEESAQRLKRVFGIEINRCEHCGGALKIMSSR